MRKLAEITVEQLQEWAIEAREAAIDGQLPDYIPLLARADRKSFAVCIQTLQSSIVSVGNPNLTFPLMSAIKPFLLLYCITSFGIERVFDRVGKQPSDSSFNSLRQLEMDNGFPRNPMINSGAIALADLLPGETALSRCEALQNWLNQQDGSKLFLSESVLQSVISKPNPRNIALASELEKKGSIQNARLALEAYNYICCLSGTVHDLAALGISIANSPAPIRSIVLEIMTTCGLYEASEEFAKKVGLPTKSGVSGVMLSVVNSRGSIACYSPPLNLQGNSIAGLSVIDKIAEFLKSDRRDIDGTYRENLFD
jgi:glutaminase